MHSVQVAMRWAVTRCAWSSNTTAAGDGVKDGREGFERSAGIS